MKIIALISRLLLGLTFLVYGLNGFFHFIPMALPSGVAGQFLTALVASRYLLAVAAVMVVAGVLLLINRYVPLALTLLGPVIVNILLLHQGMIYVGLPYAIPEAMDISEVRGGSPYGAGTIATPDGSRQPSAKELAMARFQGKHVAGIAAKLKAS